MTLRPVDELPVVRDADLKARVTGRTATVTIGQATMDTPGGRKLNITDFVFEVPDMAPKPSPARIKFRIDGPVPAVAEILASDRWSEFTGTLIDPNTSKGTVSAQVTLGLPIKRELTKADTTYTITADLGGFAADRLVMNQKLEANTLKVVANNQGYQVKGDVKINGQRRRSIIASRTRATPMSNCRRRSMTPAGRGSASISAPRCPAQFRSS